MFCDHVNFGMSRREFFGRFGMGVGGVALMNLLQRSAGAAPESLRSRAGLRPDSVSPFKGILSQPHFAPRAKRIIYLFMAGGPSQHDLFDYKPLLNQMNGEDLPESVRGGQRLTGMS